MFCSALRVAREHRSFRRGVGTGRGSSQFRTGFEQDGELSLFFFLAYHVVFQLSLCFSINSELAVNRSCNIAGVGWHRAIVDDWLVAMLGL